MGTPSKTTLKNKRKVFQLFLRSCGYRNVQDLISRISIASALPTAEGTGVNQIRDYSLVLNTATNKFHWHTTGNTFSLISPAFVDDISNGSGFMNMSTSLDDADKHPALA